MSVIVKRWIGRTGNQLFQYAAARYVAMRNNLYLETEWPNPNFLKVVPWNNVGDTCKHPEVLLTDLTGAGAQKNMLNGTFNQCRVILDGYFQDVAYFNNNREQIREWFEPCQMPRNTEDWVLHYRTTDYWHPQVDSMIEPEWYYRILKSNSYFDGKNGDRVLIVTDDVWDPCVGELQKMIGNKCHISDGNPKQDFDTIRSSDRVICGNSSFSWWAAFLGKPKVCFTFKSWMRFSPLNLANMAGATPVDGQFAANKQMQEKNLKGAWQK